MATRVAKKQPKHKLSFVVATRLETSEAIHIYRQAARAANLGLIKKKANMVNRNVLCPDCNKIVQDTEKGVECEICEIWFH